MSHDSRSEFQAPGRGGVHLHTSTNTRANPQYWKRPELLQNGELLKSTSQTSRVQPSLLTDVI